MIERIWYGNSPLAYLLLPLTAVFFLISLFRRVFYRAGLMKVGRVDVPVIIVGNITVGGTGKTPLVVWLADYLKAKQQFEDIIIQLIEKISDFDKHIIGAEPKKCIFRLYRDIRFSKDKRPYKENMGGFINREGRKGMDGGNGLPRRPETVAGRFTSSSAPGRAGRRSWWITRPADP